MCFLSNIFPTLYLQPYRKSSAALGFCRTFPLNNFNKRLTCFESSCRGARLQSQPLRKCIYWPQPRIVQLPAFLCVKVALQWVFRINLERQKGGESKNRGTVPFFFTPGGGSLICAAAFAAANSIRRERRNERPDRYVSGLLSSWHISRHSYIFTCLHHTYTRSDV